MNDEVASVYWLREYRRGTEPWRYRPKHVDTIWGARLLVVVHLDGERQVTRPERSANTRSPIVDTKRKVPRASSPRGPLMAFTAQTCR